MRSTLLSILVGLFLLSSSPCFAQAIHRSERAREPRPRPARIDAGGAAESSAEVGVIVVVEGDALAEFHRQRTSPLLAGARPFRMDEADRDPDMQAHRRKLQS